jgi:hypothetical protein
MPVPTAQQRDIEAWRRERIAHLWGLGLSRGLIAHRLNLRVAKVTQIVGALGLADKHHPRVETFALPSGEGLRFGSRHAAATDD